MVIKVSDDISRYIINKRTGYVDKKSKKQVGYLRFDLGESDSGLDKRLQDKLKDISISNLAKRYPSKSYNKIISRIASKLNLDYGNISLSPGANEIIERITRVFLNKGDACIIINPTFFRFEDSCLRRTDNIINIYLEKKNRFEWSDDIVQKISSPEDVKLIWICNPINPTGHVISKHYIESILEQNTNSIVIVDEAYGDYVPNWEHISAVGLVEEFDNLIVIKTLSKYFGMAGLRFGYAISSEPIIKALKSIQLEFDITTVTQKVVECFLNIDTPNKDLIETNIKERTTIVNSLKKMSCYEFLPSMTNTILIKHKYKNLFSELKNQNILTADMNHCRGIDNLGFVRMTVQTNSDMNRKLVQTLKSIRGDER